MLDEKSDARLDTGARLRITFVKMFKHRISFFWRDTLGINLYNVEIFRVENKCIKNCRKLLLFIVGLPSARRREEKQALNLIINRISFAPSW